MMVGRVWVIAALAVGILAAPLATEAQQPAKVPRIGVLLSGSRSSTATRTDAFRQGLRELGYVEGQNIAIEYRYAEGKVDRLPPLAAELVRLNVDVIVAGGSTANCQESHQHNPYRHGLQ